MDEKRVEAVRTQLHSAVEFSRERTASALRDLIRMAEEELRRVEAGEKVMRNVNLATRAGFAVEAMAAAEVAQESANAFAWMTGKG
jgi:hypothetical protein